MPSLSRPSDRRTDDGLSTSIGVKGRWDIHSAVRNTIFAAREFPYFAHERTGDPFREMQLPRSSRRKAGAPIHHPWGAGAAASHTRVASSAVYLRCLTALTDADGKKRREYVEYSPSALFASRSSRSSSGKSRLGNFFLQLGELGRTGRTGNHLRCDLTLITKERPPLTWLGKQFFFFLFSSWQVQSSQSAHICSFHTTQTVSVCGHA